MGAFWVAFFIYAVIFGVAGGVIRSNQGGEFAGGFAWGFVLGLIGLIVVAATKPKPRATAPLPAGPPATPAGGSPSPAQPSPGGNGATRAVPQAVRECPYCKEAMRRDASVCPHCRRDSDAWRYWEGRWWSPAGTPPLWYDERTAGWRDLSEIPMPTADRFDVVVREITKPKNTTRMARTIADTTGEPAAVVLESLGSLPATVVTASSYATAEGVRFAVASKGAAAELRPHEVRAPTAPPTATAN